MEKVVDFTYYLGGLELSCTALVIKELADDVTDGFTDVDVHYIAHEGVDFNPMDISYKGKSVWTWLEEAALEAFNEV